MGSTCPRAMLLVCLLAACAEREPQMHGVPAVAVPCAIEEGDLDFHGLLTKCMYVRERYQVLFGRPVHPVTILVRDTTAMNGYVRDGRVVFEQPGMAAMARARSSFARQTTEEWGDEPTWLLEHELGHLLLVADTRREPDGYGTILPDWADEGVAIWTESEERRAERMRQAAALDDLTLDILTFVTMRHPSRDFLGYQHFSVFTSMFRCQHPPCGVLSPVGRDTFRIVSVIDANGVAHVDTLFPEDPGFHRLDGGTYYAVASTILPFFHDAGGPPLVNEIFDRMLAGTNGADLFADLPGLPPDPADVNREWRAFVRASAAGTAR